MENEMKISELVERLEEIKKVEGDIEVTIHADQETCVTGRSEDTEICTITWKPEPLRVMLCDRYTFAELT